MSLWGILPSLFTRGKAEASFALLLLNKNLAAPSLFTRGKAEASFALLLLNQKLGCAEFVHARQS